jgi:hypothetical protein
MSKAKKTDAGDLLAQHAESWSKEVKPAHDLMKAGDQELFALLAARASDPQEAFGTPGDRFGTRYDPATLPKGPSVFELGRRIFLRCADALRTFLCAPNDDDKELRDRIKSALVARDASAIAIIAGGLVAAFGMGAAAAAVVATLLLRIIVVPTVNVLCEEWDKQIKEAISKAAK